MTKKKESDKDSEKKVLGTGAAGDPQHPEAGVPANYAHVIDVTAAEADAEKEKSK